MQRNDAAEIISRAEGKTAREIDDLLAPLRPEPAKKETMRLVAISAGIQKPVMRVTFGFHGPVALREAIDRIRQLLSHKYPAGALEDVLLEVVNDYLQRHDPQKGLPGRLSPVRGSSSIAAVVRREVWGRDGARCAHISTTGVRCLARQFLEIDHVKPRALGGGDDASNLRLLCRAHNDSERRRLLGEGGAPTWALGEGRKEIPGSRSCKPAPRPGNPRCASP